MTHFSFEFFPAKTKTAQDKLLETFHTLNALAPDYFSVTYGAGGSTRDTTLEIVETLLGQSDTPIAPHLSCIGDSKAEILKLLSYYRSIGVTRLVALRGDLPSGQVGMGELPFACDLVRFIRAQTGDDFDIKVAAYPEMHPQAPSFSQDIDFLVGKFQAGASAAITQFFYNADSYFYLRDQLVRRGVDLNRHHLVAGIMPIINASNLIRFADASGADVPRYIRKQLGQYGDDKKAILDFGFEVVCRLCERLIAGGVDRLHFYTLNKAAPTERIVRALGLV